MAWSFPNDRVYYTAVHNIACARLHAATYGNSDNRFINALRAQRPEITGNRNRSLSHSRAKGNRVSNLFLFRCIPFSFSLSDDRVLRSALSDRLDFARVSRRALYNEGPFYSQKKKMHNKSPDLSSARPVAPTS